MFRSVGRSAAGVIASLCVAAATSQAQSSFESLGRIHLSFAEDQLVQSLHVQPFTPFDVYLLLEFDSTVTTPAMSTLEAGLRFDSSISFNTSEWYDSSAHLMLSLSPGLMQILETWSDCTDPAEGLRAVASFRAIVGEGVANALIGIEAVAASSFGGLGPGWHSCGAASYLFEGASGSGMQLTLNPTVPVEGASWGSMKAEFGKEPQ
jgi:hypothetical protein